MEKDRTEVDDYPDVICRVTLGRLGDILKNENQAENDR